MGKYVVGITGASGVVFGVGVLRELLKTADVHLVMSAMAVEILKEEAGIDWAGRGVAETGKRIRDYFSSERLSFWSEDDMHAPLASGSFLTDGMLVVPCSMKTLAGIASGYAENLVQRAADVTIKEGRPLVLSPRETPLSAVHLENMLKLSRLGVKIVPPVPAFYQKPGSVEDMVNFVVGKVLDAMGIKHELFMRWEGQGSP